ncbi:MAG TPA: efflux RND transporter periplasmic adaptor subunit [Bacteroidales bacterium]|nr:efflux RND transporter periplasmic adaptor subunit [Bacteroidales bacterium]HSA43283.1 efflux RND transporter periplasmic adaptor subunit [Bacteroidales bacterium]
MSEIFRPGPRLAWMLLLPVLIACSSGKEKQSTGKDRLIPVEVFIANEGSLSQALTVTGTLIPNESVSLHPEISGRIQTILFSEGSEVKKGMLLVKLNDDEQQAQLRKLTVNESQAASEEKRKKALLDIKGISQEEYDRSLSVLLGIRADIDLLKAQIEKTEIRAPFHGICGLRNVSEGSYVSPATEIANLVQTQPLKLEFSVPERMSASLESGKEVSFFAGDASMALQATVYALEPVVDPSTRTRKVRALYPNPGNHLKPGNFARVEVRGQAAEDAVILPAQSIIPRLNGYDVFLLEDGKVARKAVIAGTRTDSLVEILQGIRGGDSILMTGLLQVKPGTGVRVTGVQRFPEKGAAR